MPAGWSSVLEHLARHGFLGDAGALGPLGHRLLRHLTTLWRSDVELGLNMAVLPAAEPPALPPDQGLPPAALRELSVAAAALGLRAPLGVCAERPPVGRLVPPDSLPVPSDASGGRLSLLVAVPPPSGDAWLQTLQRRRRIWWRELADDPANYSLTQPAPGDARVMFDGRLPVERLASHGLHTLPRAASGHQQQQHQVHVLSCELCLTSALYAVSGDALQAGALRLRRPLVPYARAVPAYPGWPEPLRALAAHVTNQLHSAGVSVFPLPSVLGEDELAAGEEVAAGERTAGDQHVSAEELRWRAAVLRRTDGAGVPLTVLLSERTLEDGVCGLRSRDTTLVQQVHVSQLTNTD